MKKLAVFCLPGQDSFLSWVPHLEDEYDVKLIVTSDNQEVFRAMAWTQIIFVEWCNEMAVNISRRMINTPNAADKKLIIRLHSYEVFTEFPNRIIWQDVDRLIFVANHIEKIMEDRFPHVMKLMDGKTEVVNNGVDIENIELLSPGHGLNIAVVGSITHKKNPAMVLQILKDVQERSGQDYKIHWAGGFYEPRYEIYLKYMIKELNLSDHVIFYGNLTKPEMDKFWKGKNFILNTSVHEGHNVSLIEAMARDITPVIHKFFGAEELYSPFNTYWTVKGASLKFIHYPQNIVSTYRDELVQKGWTLVDQVNEFKRILGEL